MPHIYTSSVWGFPHSSVGKESACNAEDPGLIPGLERSAREGTGYPLWYSWASLVAQLVKNPPTMQETWIQFLGKIPWRRERLPTPVFWPRELHGLYSPWDHKESNTTERLNWTEKLYMKTSRAHRTTKRYCLRRGRFLSVGNDFCWVPSTLP